MLWAIKKQGLSIDEIKSLSVQQIFDLLFYDAEVAGKLKGEPDELSPQTTQDFKELSRRLNG